MSEELGLNSNEQILLINNIESVFVKKECDKTKPNVRASIVASVGGMAPAIDGDYTKEETLDKCAALYNLDEETKKIVQMITSTYVYPAIGYAVIYEDFERAREAYLSNKEQYDKIYRTLAKINTIEKGMSR